MATQQATPSPVSERVVLRAKPGVTASRREPVRIFVGSEAAHQRAERVLIWSIERVRDPSRVYEIHLLRNLTGFRQRGWRTGFTNFRFAVPHLAGGLGRALYNDADQLYLADPAELFDSDLAGAGYRARSPEDTSVMLMDCARLSRIWTLREAQRRPKARLQRRAATQSDLFAALDSAWNARDCEYDPHESKCLHFTTLASQPWRPFPERFVYDASPANQVFHEIEREADTHGYQIFRRDRPSTGFAAWLASRPGSIGPDPELPPRWGVTDTAPFEPAKPIRTHSADGITACGTLDAAPADDLPWLFDEIAAGARRWVHVTIHSDPPSYPLRALGVPAPRPRTPAWWLRQVEVTAARHPGLNWQLDVALPDGRRQLHEFGRRICPDPPRVWVLTDDRPGNTSQSMGLALHLGWPTAIKALVHNPLATFHNRLLGASRVGVRGSRSAPLEPPWPDLVIAAGRRNAPVADWVRAQNRGATRVVLLGRKAGDAAERCDLSVVPAYARLFPHPHRMTTSVPLHLANEERLAAAAEEWKERFAGLPSPRIGVLVGGSSGQFRLPATTARRLAHDVVGLAKRAGGSLLATTGRRTGRAATEAFCAAVGDAGFVHRFDGAASKNPYGALLALADAFVVTGDSESMLAEAIATGRPVAIYPLPSRASFRLLRFPRDWIAARARESKTGRRGVARPQQGLSYLAARLIDRGFVRPTRDLNRLHEDLFARNAAHRFGEDAPRDGLRAPSDLAGVASRVRRIMGV